ncbi:macrolide family glycosyltransferase [Pseudonocardia sp. CA-142604]|uniref:macrolide family glycosyltransferase n=1 Tax=Pseudonocardia sp. CA-142604 TaxID=3240024 RepID=UPI003D8E470B
MASISAYRPMGAGHVNPTLGIVAELVRRGHEVTYWAPAQFADRIAETGARFVPITSTWETMGRDALPQMHGKELIRAIDLLLGETKALVPILAEAEPPDLVVHDGTLAWWGRILARRWGVPSVETWPNLVSNGHWSMNAYARINPLSPRFLRTLLRTGRYLRQQGITDIEGFMQGNTAALRIVTVPRAFQYAGDTFTDGYTFVGPCLTERAFQPDWTPPRADVPVLLVSLGTAYNDRPDFYRMVAASAAGRRWHVVMAVGDLLDSASIGPLPPNVEVHAQVPQLAVLRHAGVFATHAGMGSTMEGLYFRVPLVALPQMAEQRANADRITELGLGRALDPDGLTAPTFWNAVDAVADDTAIRERLAWMRGEIDTAGGATAAADAIARLLSHP